MVAIVVMQHAIYWVLDCFDLPTHCHGQHNYVIMYFVNIVPFVMTCQSNYTVNRFFLHCWSSTHLYFHGKICSLDYPFTYTIAAAFLIQTHTLHLCTQYEQNVSTKINVKLYTFMYTVYIFSQVPITYGQCVVNGKSHIRMIRLYNYTHNYSIGSLCLHVYA